MVVKKRKISPRKTPKQDRSQGLVDAILTASARILVRSGFDGSTTNKIAELAGVSIGSLYQYFPNKEALIGALIERQIGQNKQRLEAKLKELEGQSFEEMIDGLLQVTVELFIRNRALLRNVIALAPRLERLDVVLKTRNSFGAVLAKLLKENPERVRPANIKLAVYVLIHAVVGVLQTAIMDTSESYSEGELQGALAEMAKGYLLKRPV